MASLKWFRLTGLAAPVLALLLTGCMSFGDVDGGGGGTATAAADEAGDGEIDIRRYLGPDYCPEIRVLPGTQLMRRHDGAEEDPKSVVWQASIGNTARECLYDGQGGLTLRIGVSGRVVAGPKGGAATVQVPLRIAVIKYRETILTSEIYPLSVTIPPSNSAVFTQVYDVDVPSPGNDRDYIIFIGLDAKGDGMVTVDGTPPAPPPPPPVRRRQPPPAVQAPVRQAPAAPAPTAAPTTAPAGQTPNVLPVPEGMRGAW